MPLHRVCDDLDRTPTPRHSQRCDSVGFATESLSSIKGKLRDHTLLPLMALGCWWTDSNPLHDTIVELMHTSSDAIAAASSQQCVCCVPGIGACNLSQLWALFVSILASVMRKLFGCIWQQSDSRSSSSRLPPNGVHGWIYLNADGSLCCQEKSIPK